MSVAYGSFLEFFLTWSEKERFADWREKGCVNRTVTTRLFSWAFDHVAKHIPDSVAPNLLTVVGMVSVLQAWYLSVLLGPASSVTSAFAVVAIVVYWTMHSVDGSHAVRLKQDSPLGELFKFACDSVAGVFIPMLLCQVLGAGENFTVQWYAVQLTHVSMCLKHYLAFTYRREFVFHFLGPGELLTAIAYVLIFHSVFGVEMLFSAYCTAFAWVRSRVVMWAGRGAYHLPTDPAQVGQDGLQGLYFVLFLVLCTTIYFSGENAAERGARSALRKVESANSFRTLVKSSLKRRARGALGGSDVSEAGVSEAASETDGDDSCYDGGIEVDADSSTVASPATVTAPRRKGQAGGYTRWGVLLCLACRLLPFLLRQLRISEVSTTLQDVVLDGLFMGVLTCDLIVARMAGRELHPWVLVMCLTVLLPGFGFMLVFFVCFYFLSLFGDLSHHLNLPLLTPCRNVYCDGVYDLCHVGHKNLFQAALKHGNRLYAGVCGDKDCAQYKRPPIMTCKERCAEVASCKAVTKVIPNAPTFGITEEFLEKHRIHVVCCGQEYFDRYPDPKDDPYYSVPRLKGMAVALPRTPGLSTSDLIRRIQASGSEKRTPHDPRDGF